jgi:hypothetical protein
MKTPQRNQRTGSALVVVLSVVGTLAATVAISMEYTATVRRNVQRSEAMQTAISIADSSLEKSFSYWREICRASTDSALGTTAFSSIPLPAQAEFPNVPNFTASTLAAAPGSTPPTTISNFSVIAVDPEMNPIAVGAPLVAEMGQGKAHMIYHYLAQADVSLPVLTGRVTTRVRRVFQKEQVSPWNWAIFYVDPLEIQPGALMNITGWVHTNSNLYTGHSDLHFQSKVTYGSDWVVGFRPGDSRAPNGTAPEVPTTPSYPSNLPPAYDVSQQPFGLDSTRIFSTADSNPNNDSYHELIEPPKSGYKDPLEGKRYYDQAGVKILIDSSNNVVIRDGNDNVINGGTLYSVFSSAVTTNQSIQDNREGAPVRLATLDMGAVSSKVRDGTLAGFNGVIYIADTSASSTGGTPKRGIRLKNGAIMPSGGLTVASQNPVYIQGDYNTGGSNPPSNSGDATKPVVPGYDRAACAIICDAVNILSNSWKDSNAALDLDQRVASNTTINAAIVAGIVPSANNDYSGGAENFPRFLEEWGNKTFTYYGSMVELFSSRQSIGTWGADNIYGAPKRQWFFDSNLLVNVPPGSLPVFSYVKGRWFLADN